MNHKTLDISDVLEPDHIAKSIADKWVTWDSLREKKKRDWTEIQSYIFATDTSTTSNSGLPWSNRTTIPKLCQIRDNLHANYMATLFPRSKWLEWVGDNEDDNSLQKREAIEAYMQWATDREQFYSTVSRLTLDTIDFGNAFCMPDWVDETIVLEDGTTKVGYVGPAIRRISPYDIVFNPTAPSFRESPKIIKSVISLGELKELLLRESITDTDRQDAMDLFDYLKKVRVDVASYSGEYTEKDMAYRMDGFTSFKEYLNSNLVEILTFYGDMYDEDSDTLYKNHVIKVVDRHKIVSKRPNPSFFGTAPIYHVPWRERPDNLWGMGPLDNLVGMQYRIDHLENMKADVFDLIAYPPVKIKGYVEDFKWGPLEHIYVDADGDVELMSPDVQALQADNQIAILERKMEEMAGAPREALGIRSPGEKTAFEVQRIENASARIFLSKTLKIERDQIEPALNGMLELARRMAGPSIIRVFDDELKINVFMNLTPLDLTGAGSIRPIAARNFAEKATQIQNITNFYASAAGQDPGIRMHFSGVQLARMFEDLLDIKHFNAVQPYVSISEQAEAQRIAQSQEEQVMMEAQTAGGIIEGDHDAEEEGELALAQPPQVADGQG